MGELIVVIIIIAITAGAIYFFLVTAKNEKLNNYVNECLNNSQPIIPNNPTTSTTHEGVIYDKKEPLDKNIFIQQMTYANRKQDSRTDELLNTLDRILFWVRIIGLYALIKILIAIIKILAGATAGAYALEILNKLL